MPREEITGERPTNFSRWHRQTLPPWCCLADVDWAEVRAGQVVAFLETIELAPEGIDGAGEWIKSDPWLKCWYPKYDRRYPLWETKKVVFNYLLSVSRKAFYVVYHTPNMSQVKVVDYRKKTLYQFDGKGFADWLQML